MEPTHPRIAGDRYSGVEMSPCPRCEQKQGTLMRLRDAIPAELDPWLREAIETAIDETLILLNNGAFQSAAGRQEVICKLLSAAADWLNDEISVREVARLWRKSEETVRRKLRAEALPNHRATPRGAYRMRRGDLTRLDSAKPDAYNPTADAQDIAELRRNIR